MEVLNLVFSALLPVVGGLAAAILLCAGLWRLLMLVRHPEFGPVLGLASLTLLLMIGVRVGQLLAMAAVFLLIPAVVLWPEGARWRKRHPAH